MINHYGTTPLIRQCVTPGMMALHEGRTYRVSAVIQERKWVYLHTDAEIIRLSDCVIDVLLTVTETLSSTNHPIQPIGLAQCGRNLHIQISGVQP